MKCFIRYFFALIVLFSLGSWGFFAHMRITRYAVFSLPSGISRFYKANIQYLSDHAVDADKRRYADTSEAPRHYLDVELYEKDIDSIPRKWDDAVKKYGIARLNENGILPWQIQVSYYKLVNAFKTRDSLKILVYSAYLGHYLADAHVPLHTTQNHNGQLTNQTGIHAFWESRLPELFANDYNYLVGKARYVNNPLKEAWTIITHTHSLVDSVLKCESRVDSSFASHRKYGFSKRNNLVVRQYSVAYSKAYHRAMNDMVARQMRAAILAIGSYWYSAWIDAGQPSLENLVKIPIDTADKKAQDEAYKKYEKGHIIGREN
ncbi:zinc dependent phospholipase C family protein [Pedobacter psychroterrae]|nr:zinc dependent phospholipase C family protein [Pedobacter psychroterrae]